MSAYTRHYPDYHDFVFNPEDNGGEQLSLTTSFDFHNKDEYYLTHKLRLMSYGMAVTLDINNITPEKLRKLADELEVIIEEAKADFGK